jgi:hypothetical protein
MVTLTSPSRRNKYASIHPVIRLLWICALSALPSGLVLYPWLLSIDYGQRALIKTNDNKEGGALDGAAVVTVGPCGGQQDEDCFARWKELQEKIQVERLITTSLMTQERERSNRDPYNRRHPEQNQRQQEKDQRYWHEYLGKNGATTSPFYGEGTSFPDLNVVGFCKTGTSQLYHVFGTHQDVIYTAHKELCTDAWKDTLAKQKKDGKVGALDSVFQWHNYFYKERQSQPGKKTINGCMSISDLQRRYYYNPPIPVTRSKFFLIFRDPAEWTWSVFNFFYDKHFEDRPEENAWVNATLHYRSPELFHELFLAGQGKLHPSKYMFELRDRTVPSARTVVAVAGRENVMFLRNEDLQPEMVVSSGTLDRLSNMTGLSLDRFDPTAIQTKTNCNDNKSLKGKSCSDEDDSSRKKKGGYAVTHNRPMLEATRKLIYIQWHEECKVWAEEFGIVYPDCLSAVPDEEEVDTPKGNEKEEVGAVPQ